VPGVAPQLTGGEFWGRRCLHGRGI
jgi:hypothetical protein